VRVPQEVEGAGWGAALVCGEVWGCSSVPGATCTGLLHCKVLQVLGDELITGCIGVETYGCFFGFDAAFDCCLFRSLHGRQMWGQGGGQKVDGKVGQALVGRCQWYPRH